MVLLFLNRNPDMHIDEGFFSDFQFFLENVSVFVCNNYFIMQKYFKLNHINSIIDMRTQQHGSIRIYCCY